MIQPKKSEAAAGCDPCEERCCDQAAKWESKREQGGGFPLCMSRVGDTVEVCRVLGGKTGSGRLMEMGILPGQTIKVAGNLGGPMIVEVKGARLSLGRGLAMKIMVK